MTSENQFAQVVLARRIDQLLMMGTDVRCYYIRCKLIGAKWRFAIIAGPPSQATAAALSKRCRHLTRRRTSSSYCEFGCATSVGAMIVKRPGCLHVNESKCLATSISRHQSQMVQLSVHLCRWINQKGHILRKACVRLKGVIRTFCFHWQSNVCLPKWSRDRWLTRRRQIGRERAPMINGE